jgi:hypothetical protein
LLHEHHFPIRDELGKMILSSYGQAKLERLSNLTLSS